MKDTDLPLRISLSLILSLRGPLAEPAERCVERTLVPSSHARLLKKWKPPPQSAHLQVPQADPGGRLLHHHPMEEIQGLETAKNSQGQSETVKDHPLATERLCGGTSMDLFPYLVLARKTQKSPACRELEAAEMTGESDR